MRQQQGARPTSGKRHWVSARGRGHDSRSKPRALLQPPEPALCARLGLHCSPASGSGPLPGPPRWPGLQTQGTRPPSVGTVSRPRTVPGVCCGVTWGSGAGSRLRLRGTDGGWAASVVTERGSGPSLCRSRKRPRIDPEPEVSGPGAGIPSPGVPPGLRRGSGRAWWLTARAATACRHRLPPPPAATRCHCWEMHSPMAGRPAGEAQASLWLAGKKG